jgi:hypothetical protein
VRLRRWAIWRIVDRTSITHKPIERSTLAMFVVGLPLDELLERL